MSSSEKRGSTPKTEMFPNWLGMPTMFAIVLAAAVIVTAILVYSSGRTPDVAVEKPASMNDCISATLKFMTKDASSSPELVKFVKEHCYSLLRSQGLLNSFYISDLAYVQQYRTNPVLLWLVVGVTLSGVILAALQLLAAFQLAMVKDQDIDGGGAMSVKRNEVALKSSVTGLFILLMSFAFFLVFVLYVYRIEPPKDNAPLPTQPKLAVPGTLDPPPSAPASPK